MHAACMHFRSLNVYVIYATGTEANHEPGIMPRPGSATISMLLALKQIIRSNLDCAIEAHNTIGHAYI
jgi:hypothetical protein